MALVIKRIIKIISYFLAATIILAALVVCVLGLLTPVINKHKADFEKWSSDLLHVPVTIGSIHLSWLQYSPELKLRNVTILNKDTHQPALQIKHLGIFFSIFKSVWQRQPIINGMLIAGTKITLIKSAVGNINIQELKDVTTSLPDNTEPKLTDVIGWLYQQPYFILRNIDIHYSAPTSQDRFVTIYNLKMVNTHADHSMVAKAILHQEIPTEMTLEATCKGDTFDLDKINLKGYAYVTGLSLSQWVQGLSWQGWQIQHGVVSAKVWFAWQHGMLQKIQTTFQAYQLDLYSQNNKSSHKINRFSGNIGWKRAGNRWILAGDDILIDLTTHLWPVTSFYFTATPDTTGKWQPKTIGISYLDLADIQSFVFATPAILPESINSILSRLQLSGNLQNTTIDFSNAVIDLEHVAVTSNFNQISFNAWNNFPGLTNLTGKLNWDGVRGQMILDSKRSRLSYGTLFANDVGLQQLSADLQWQQNKIHAWNIQVKALQILNDDAAVNLHGDILLPPAQSPILNLAANYTLPKVSHLAYYLPMKAFPVELAIWLQNAFLAGELKSGTAIFQGAVSDFPFDNHNGIFSAAAVVNNIDLRYADNWPILQRINGKINYTGRKMSIAIDNALLGDIILQTIQAEIPYFGDAQPQVLHVQCNQINADFSQALAFIHVSPLEATLGKIFTDVAMHGPIALQLGLIVPLSHPDNTQVNGDLSMQDANINVTSANLLLNHLNGRLQFTEHSLLANDIQAQLFNKPFQFNLDTINKAKNLSVVRASFANNLDISDLQNWLQIPFTSFVTGGAQVVGKIDFSTQAPLTMNFKSNLVGIKLSLPNPFAKPLSQPKDLSLDLILQNNKLLKIKVDYANLLSSAFNLQRTNNKYNLLGANIQLGGQQAAWPTKTGMFIAGRFSTLDWNDIKPYVNQTGASNFPKDLLKNINIHADKFLIFGQTLSQIDVQLNPIPNMWEININSPDMIGKILMPVTLTPQSLISAKFDKLNLTSSSNSQKTAIIDIKSLPQLALSADKVNYNNMLLGQIAIKTQPSSRGMTIQSIRISSPLLNLQANGAWINQKNYLTNLQGTASSPRLSDLLKSFGFDVHNFISNKATLKFNLNWNDAPYVPALASLNGNASIDLGPGRIVDIGQGNGAKMELGQLLSIFSLQSIPRRLSFDFSDVFQKGYSFDFIRGDFNLKNGNAFTNNFKIDGTLAKLAINGEIGLATKDFNLILVVTPSVTSVTSSIPVAATLLTGNPLIGLGALAVNSVIGSQVSKVTTYYYSVTGTWTDPIWKSVKIAKKNTSRAPVFLTFSQSVFI